MVARAKARRATSTSSSTQTRIYSTTCTRCGSRLVRAAPSAIRARLQAICSGVHQFRHIPSASSPPRRSISGPEAHNETAPGQLAQRATTHGKGDRGTVQHRRDPNASAQACWYHLTAGGPALGAELEGILACPFRCPDTTVAAPGRFLGEDCL